MSEKKPKLACPKCGVIHDICPCGAENIHHAYALAKAAQGFVQDFEELADKCTGGQVFDALLRRLALAIGVTEEELDDIKKKSKEGLN